MSNPTVPAGNDAPEARESWVPMVAIALGQVLMSFNVSSLPIALSGIVRSFNVEPTLVSTAIVMYSLSVAGLVMLGAKLCQRYGPLLVFRVVVLLFGAAMALMTFSVNGAMLISAQAMAGAAGAALVPSLVALIAENYRGQQQATALGALGSAGAGAGVAAFVVGGVLGTFVGWRPAFGILIALSAIVFALSFRLKGQSGRDGVQIDLIGVALSAVSIVLISLGFDNLNGWGVGLAQAGAPFSIGGLSPAPVMIVMGIVLAQAFLVWTRRRQAAKKTPLLALEVVESPSERVAVYAMFTIVAIEAGLNFMVPLYIQIVQGQSPLATTIAMLPFNLTVFFVALLIIRVYDKIPPRQIGRLAFAFSAIALFWLAFVVHNNWSTIPVLLGLIVFGIGQGSLVTLLFNVLVTASPKELAGDVGSLRGMTNNLASAIGTAASSAIMVGLLSASVLGAVANNPVIPPQLRTQVNLDNVNFVSNNRLLEVLQRTTATPEQIAAAMDINEEARLRALRIGLLIMAGFALLALIPAGRLPAYKPGEVPPDAA